MGYRKACEDFLEILKELPDYERQLMGARGNASGQNIIIQ
jgi:hypothetical protein